jgi:hypothetical protein
MQLGITDIIFQRYNNQNLYTVLEEVREKKYKKLSVLGNHRNLQEIPMVDYFNFFLNNKKYRIDSIEFLGSKKLKKDHLLLQTPWSRKDFKPGEHLVLVKEFSAPHIMAKENLNYLISYFLARLPNSNTLLADRMYVRDGTYRLYRYNK